MSRGVFRWRSTDRATDVGELKKPEIMTSRIASGIDVADAYRSPHTPMPVRPPATHSDSGNRAEKRAMKNDPITKPTEVSPSWRPYSNSVAWSSRSDIGSSRTFHSPNEKNIR